LRIATTLALAIVLSAAPQVRAHPDEHPARQAPWQEASAWPDRIIATIDADPARAISVSWRTEAGVTATRAEIAPATPDARFDLAARSVTAETRLLDLASISHAGMSALVEHNRGLPKSAHHSVRFEGLTPDTLYAYRVQGAEGTWSEWFQTRTAPARGPVRFIYLGDAQNDLDSHWPRVIRAAFQTAPDARFILHAGDLVNRGSRDLEWAQWFRAGGFIHGMIPAIPVAGNHEYDTYELAPAQKRKLLSLLWRPQFRLPAAPGLPEELQETVYEVRYSPDLHVFVLDSNMADMTAQAEWLDARLAASDARWRVVTMHHPVYSSGRDRDNPDKRAVLLPVLVKHKVDLVLQGHDHTYARGTLPARSQTPSRQAATSGEEVVAMFVNSVSGPKQYEFSKDGWAQYAPTGVRLDRRGENTQFYQVIGIEGDTLDYAAYTADGQLYDAFRLAKTADGAKTLVPVAPTLPPERGFANTMPYPKD
jgi:3',5'-cyclic AMP phosphodiesterase CpdA